MLAIPNYARMNRAGAPPEYPGDDDAKLGRVESKVWI